MKDDGLKRLSHEEVAKEARAEADRRIAAKAEAEEILSAAEEVRGRAEAVVKVARDAFWHASEAADEAERKARAWESVLGEEVKDGQA